jgi:phosphoribosylaminoimidazole-succinocarboxamide synthase
MYYEIQEQLDDIKKVTEKVAQSKELANNFLNEAGIILEDKKEDEKTPYTFGCSEKK